MNKSPSERRLAENEVYFRQLNENVQEGITNLAKLADENRQHNLSHQNDSPLHFYCECSDENCRDRIIITPSEYNQIHSHRNRFIIIPGHEVVAVEKVITEHQKFFIVEKYLNTPETVSNLNITDIDNG